jgi:hypothetical protein
MNTKRTKLPLPIGTLVLSAALALLSVVGERAFQAGPATQTKPPAPTTDQQRGALRYFKVLGWLSRIAPAGGTQPTHVPPTPSASQLGHVRSVMPRAAGAELCSLTLGGTTSRH